MQRAAGGGSWGCSGQGSQCGWGWGGRGPAGPEGDAEFHSATQQEVLEAVVPQRVASDSALMPLSAFGPKSTWAPVRMPVAWTAGGLSLRGVAGGGLCGVSEPQHRLAWRSKGEGGTQG